MSDSSGHFKEGVDVLPLDCWDRWIKCHSWHGFSFLVSVVCCASSSLCEEPITRSEESYRMCVCVCVCVYGLETSTMRRRKFENSLHCFSVSYVKLHTRLYVFVCALITWYAGRTCVATYYMQTLAASLCRISCNKLVNSRLSKKRIFGLKCFSILPPTLSESIFSQEELNEILPYIHVCPRIKYLLFLTDIIQN
jgi:hypothetical protein